ncbi:hypothetical protein AVEN_94366-1 [Araneus ventricosus]|uniref:Uncharacterized protein n=1 Tax=Araneus ventricosus TaxID=182803 RepID=A0A4Y2EA19_ARAVE|nr:hypothetical protein AVEN_94366-1 [Araneus ventricosus]
MSFVRNQAIFHTCNRTLPLGTKVWHLVVVEGGVSASQRAVSCAQRALRDVAMPDITDLPRGMFIAPYLAETFMMEQQTFWSMQRARYHPSGQHKRKVLRCRL